MPMIQPIDGGMLLNMFRQGKQDRAEIDKTRAEQARQARVQGLMGQLFGGQPSGGVEANFAPTHPVAAPVAPVGPPTLEQNFDSAFGGGVGAGAVPAAPVAPVAAAPVAPRYDGARKPDPNVLAQLIALDPETGGKLVTAFKTMDEAQLKQIEQRNSFMGAAARFVQQGRTPQERLQRFQIAAPQLIEVGFTPEQLDGIDNDLSDQRLQFYQATAIDYDRMIDNEMAEREFMAGKTVPVTAGGNVALVKPDGSARWVIGGGAGGEQAAPTGVTRIAGPEEYEALAPGARYIDPNGKLRQKPGGQTAPPSGDFRPVSNGKAVIQQLFPGARITDSRRDPNSRLGRANPGSWHNRSGGAVDIAPIKGMTFDQYVARVQGAGYKIIEARDEVKNPSGHATGPHWHIVIGEA